MDFHCYSEAYGEGYRDGLLGAPRRSTAPAYTRGYDRGFTLHLATLQAKS